jgi:AcrR family transcriptional regulator
MYLNLDAFGMIQPVRRTQVDRSTETRALLIYAATELLRTVGFAGTTTVLIAKRAGVTTGALHHHFATKDDLMFGVLAQVSERVRIHLEQQDHLIVNGNLDAGRLVTYLWEIYGDAGYWAVWEIIIGTRADAAFHRRVVADRISTMRDILHPWVERHILSDTVRPATIALFEFVLVAIRGLSLERFLDKNTAYFERNLHLLAEMVSMKLAQLTAMAANDDAGSVTAEGIEHE